MPPKLHLESAPPPAFQPQPVESEAQSRAAFDWREMGCAPHNRPVYLSPDAEDPGTLAYWRITRQKVRPGRGWRPVEYWASVLTKRAIDFTPFAWRESGGGAALSAALEREQAAQDAVAFQQAKLAETLRAAGVEEAA